MNNHIDEIIERKQEIDKLAEENMKKYKQVLNRIFSTDDGKYLYRAMVKYCGIFSIDNKVDNDTLRERNGKRKVILEFILPFLDKDVKQGLHD